MARPSFRDIPPVDELLRKPAIERLAAETGRDYVVGCIRGVLDAVRAQLRAPGGGQALDDLEARIVERVQAGLRPSLRPVINATGVVVHTNLGRAPLGSAAGERVREAACSYTNLEYDLERGSRGRRDVHAAQLLHDLLGVPAVVLNNNAAAVLLVLNTLAEGGEVIVSRGELIEIGDSFRIPEIMAKSGAILHEVGTTNRTRVADYESAINERTRLLLRVHPSNFRVVGFTERPTLDALVAVGRKHALPVFEDLGSGCLFDLRPYGIAGEPVVEESVRAGVDVVSFSGDKVLGGPQAGIVAGRAELVQRIRRNPLFRALRVDKMTYAALEATLASYRRGAFDDLPVAGMIRAGADEIAERARAFLSEYESAARGRGARARLELLPGESVIGGGSTPGQALPTMLVAVSHEELSVAAVEERLRHSDPPVIARVERDRVLLDLRTVFASQEGALLATLLSL